MAVPAARPAPFRASNFYFGMAIAFLAVALIGFSTTFFIPLWRGSFHAPLLVHAHGAILFAWLLLFITQAWLIRGREVRLHRRLGWGGALVAAGVVVSGAAIGLFAARRDLAGGGDFVLGQLVNTFVEMLLFGGFVTAAILNRRDRERHKRLLLLATISVIGPAWLRFRHILPAVGDPFVFFSLLGDGLLLVAMAHDWRSRGRIHPTYLWVGAFMILVHLAELFAAQSPPWTAAGRWLLGQA
jgi:hypothetical protein